MKKFTMPLFCCAFFFACGDSKMDVTTATTGSDGTESQSNTGNIPEPTTGNSTGGIATDPVGTSSTGADDSGCNFLDCSTTDPPPAQCDVWAQDCPDTKKCVPVSLDGDNSWETLVCVDVTPNGGAVGDECTAESIASGVDSCGSGAICWDISMDTGKGTCVEQCQGTEMAPTCSDPETLCVIANEGVLTLCLPKCDPLTQDCANMDLCIPNPQGSDGFACILDASGMEGQEWDPCGYANACDPGLLCLDPALASECPQDAQGCCLPFCDTTVMPAMCSGQGQECLSFYEMGMAPPGLENVGICGIPM